MGKIEFKREVRAGRTNDERKAANRPLIQDFAVIIDGERRGTWKRTTMGQGYTLVDARGEMIKRGSAQREGRGISRDIIARAQSAFLATTEAALEAGHIPTLAAIDQRQKDREARNAEARQAAYNSAYANVLERSGVEVLEHLEKLTASVITLHPDAGRYAQYCALIRARATDAAENAVREDR